MTNLAPSGKNTQRLLHPLYVRFGSASPVETEKHLNDFIRVVAGQLTDDLHHPQLAVKHLYDVPPPLQRLLDPTTFQVKIEVSSVIMVQGT